MSMVRLLWWFFWSCVSELVAHAQKLRREGAAKFENPDLEIGCD